MVRPDKDIRAKESLFRSKSTADGQPRASFTPRISSRSRSSSGGDFRDPELPRGSTGLDCVMVRGRCYLNLKP